MLLLVAYVWNLRNNLVLIRLPPEQLGNALEQLARRDDDMTADINVGQHRNGDEQRGVI